MLRNLGLLALAVIATLAVAGPIAWARYGESGLWAATIAATVCGVSAGASLAVVARASRSGMGVHGALLGMLIRLGAPLATGVYFQQRGGELAEAGVFGLIVVFYLVTLFVETLLSVKLIQQLPKKAGTA